MLKLMFNKPLAKLSYSTGVNRLNQSILFAKNII